MNSSTTGFLDEGDPYGVEAFVRRVITSLTDDLSTIESLAGTILEHVSPGEVPESAFERMSLIHVIGAEYARNMENSASRALADAGSADDKDTQELVSFSRAFGQLSANEQAVLTLVVVCQISLQDISVFLRTSERQVRDILSRARCNLEQKRQIG